MIKSEKIIAPESRLASGFKKEDAEKVFSLEVSKTNGYSIITPNIKAWKASFYSLRKKLCKDKQFTFSKASETMYHIWRTN